MLSPADADLVQRDRGLPGLALLLDADAFAAALHSSLPEANLGNLEYGYVRYKPERRYVARLDVDGEPLTSIKLYTRAGYEAADIATRAFGSASGLRVPRPVGRSSRHGVLAFEWQSGRQLGDIIAGPELCLEDIARVGAALAELHAQAGEVLGERTRQMEAATILATAEGLGFVYPRAARLASDLGRRLASELRRAPVTRRPIHGDFYARQVLLERNRVTILDLDEAILADPAADLGLFIAHLERDALRGELPATRIDPIRNAFLRGYGDVPDRVDLYTAIGLLQLAPHHFRNREPTWPERTLATLERAVAVVGPDPQASRPGHKGRV